MNAVTHLSVSTRTDRSRAKGARTTVFAVLLLFSGGCAMLDHLGESRPGGSGKILLVPGQGPVLLDRRAVDKYTCGAHLKVCTQVGTTRFSCECSQQ
jgi:hypothetical protein